MSQIVSYVEYTDAKGQKYYYNTSSKATSYKYPEDGVIFDQTGKVIRAPPGVKVAGQQSPAPAATPAQQQYQPAPAATPVQQQAQPTPAQTPAPVAAALQPEPLQPLALGPAPELSRLPDRLPEPDKAFHFGRLVSPTEPGPLLTSPSRDDFLQDQHSTDQLPAPIQEEEVHLAMTVDRSDPAYWIPSGRQAVTPEEAQNMEPVEEPVVHENYQTFEELERRQFNTLTGAFMSKRASSGSKLRLSGRTTEKEIPYIAKPYTAPEVLSLPLGLDMCITKQQLTGALNKYRMIDFAEEHFREHRKGGFVSAKPIPVDEITSYQDKKLKKPLLKSVPKEQKKLGAMLFELLLQCMGVSDSHKHGSALWTIIKTLQEHPDTLVDEFFFQLVKQTTQCNEKQALLKAWNLWIIIASLFPVTDDNYIYILAHLARETANSDSRIAVCASFCLFRFEARHFFGVPLDWHGDKRMVEDLPKQVDGGTACFSCLIYEIMWNQRKKYPHLPIPYVLYYIIEQLREKKALTTEGIFRIQGSKGIREGILEEVNTNMEAISRGDVHVLSDLLKIWLKELANPLVPVEKIDDFVKHAEENQFLAFMESLPQVYRNTLLYVIGFIQDVYSNFTSNQMEKSDLATIFGPCIVNPRRSAKKGHAQKVQQLTELSVAFVSKLIDEADPSQVYPLEPYYLSQDDKVPPPRKVVYCIPEPDNSPSLPPLVQDEPQYQAPQQHDVYQQGYTPEPVPSSMMMQAPTTPVPPPPVVPSQPVVPSLSSPPQAQAYVYMGDDLPQPDLDDFCDKKSKEKKAREREEEQEYLMRVKSDLFRESSDGSDLQPFGDED